ncbi:MAG: cadherin-like beta sandwich domain-containing protein [Bacteroidales bacterium]|nr:cadherin-like beta sandwich domain-containing protein [Bacteroidales bacterium]
MFEILVTYASAKDDATLNSITVNSEKVEGFAPETTTYNVELPFGTTEVPFVAATATSSNAKVSVTQAESVDGTATITVTAEDKTTTQTYTINFTVATCASAELVLSVDSIGAIIETGDLVAPTLTNPHNLSVVYASNNEEVVTVDQTGALTKVGVGEAVITITAAKQTVEGIEYCEDEISYKVTLTAHPIEGSTTIFEWVVASSNLTAPTTDSTSLDAANYGTLTIGKSVVNRYFGKNKFSVSSGMYKLGNNDVAVEFATEGGFLAEDEITIVGQNGGTGDRGFEIGNASAKGAGTEGNIASSTQSTQTANSTYTAVVDKTNEGGVLRLFRLADNSVFLKSIKVVRPCTVESGLVLDKTAIDVLDSEKTITAPKLDNPKELVVKYESSNTEVVAVDANTGALTKGTKTGMATITISWERQTINFVRYCAGELVYTVTVKSGATAVENTAVAAPATKIIRDGQLLIIREGKTYTAQGVQVQ